MTVRVGPRSGSQCLPYQNTLYQTLNGDDYPDAFPPAVLPCQPRAAAQGSAMFRLRRRID
jgi:hypothetical protein